MYQTWILKFSNFNETCFFELKCSNAERIQFLVLQEVCEAMLGRNFELHAIKILNFRTYHPPECKYETMINLVWYLLNGTFKQYIIEHIYFMNPFLYLTFLKTESTRLLIFNIFFFTSDVVPSILFHLKIISPWNGQIRNHFKLKKNSFILRASWNI